MAASGCPMSGRTTPQETLTDPTCELVKSQHGPLVSAALTALPTSRVWLCRRLFLPLPLSSRPCRCGRPLDMYGSVFEGWGVGLQRFCRAAGGRVGLDRFIRDLDVGAFNPLDGRRIEVIVDGLSLWHGAQLAVDITVVSPQHGDGTARRHAATTSGEGEGNHIPRTLRSGRKGPFGGFGGHGRLWPNRLWPNRLWASLFCYRVWPNRLWPRPTLAKTDFGQNEFDLLCVVLCCVCCCVVLCCVVLCCVVLCCVVLCCVVCCLCGVGTVSWCQGGVSCVGVGFKVWFGPPFLGHFPGPPFPWTAFPLDRPSPGPPKISLFFFPLPPQNSFFSSLSGCLLVEFWWCFLTGPSNVHVWALWLSCGTPPDWAAGASHTTTRELQTRTFERPGASNTTKIPREDPKREKEERKKREILGPPTLRGSTFRGSTFRGSTLLDSTLSGPHFSGFGPPPFGPPPFGAPPFGPHLVRPLACMKKTKQLKITKKKTIKTNQNN